MKASEVIKGAIEEIMATNGREGAIEPSSKIVQDLGFTSLDVAELVAVLEMDLAVDPFSEGVSLMDVRTYGELCTVYENACLKKG